MSNRTDRGNIRGSRTAIATQLLQRTAVAALVAFAFVSCEPLDTDSSTSARPSARLPAAEETIEELKEEVESATEELDDYEEEEVEDLVESLNRIEPQEIQDSASNIVVSLRDRIRARRGTR